jgi:hypothetical protein
VIQGCSIFIKEVGGKIIWNIKREYYFRLVDVFELRRFNFHVAIIIVFVDLYKTKTTAFNITFQFISFFVMKDRKPLLPFVVFEYTDSVVFKKQP